MGETASPYRRPVPLRHVAPALLLLTMASNFGGRLSLGYYLLRGAVVIVLIVCSSAEILIRSCE